MNRRENAMRLGLLALMALPALLLAACGADSGASSALSSLPSSAVSAPAGSGASSGSQADADAVAAPDFTLVDQYGESHTLSDYQGQVVFLNFWATWCGPCRQEMPDIEQLYQDGEENSGDYVVLGVANPKTVDNPNAQDVTEQEITAFLEEGGYTYPTVMDTTGEVFSEYGISAFPTTFIVDTEGKVVGYVAGMLSREQMDQLIAMGLE